MSRDTILVTVISLCSILAGILIYRYTLFEPEYISAKQEIVSTNQPVASMSYEDLALKNLDGQLKPLQFWDKPIQVLNFWAPWCAPCRREIPTLVDLQNKYQASVQIIGLSFDNVQNVVDFTNEYPINYPLLLVENEAAQINGFFGNSQSGLPFTVILNANREIVFRHTGEISGPQLEQEINALLKS